MTWGRGLLGAGTLVVASLTTVLLVTGIVIPPTVSAIVVLGYAGIALAGVLFPRLAMFAPVVARLPGRRREIALTFDDGPDPTTTPMVLATLARFQARATFFVLGEKARAAPEVVRAIAAAGHAIGVHGDRHDRLLALRSPRRIREEIERAQAAVAQITGQTPRLFRPPVGLISPRTALAAKRLALVLLGWSVRGRDGLARAHPVAVERRVTRALRPGAIVLLHDAAERGGRVPAGVAALPAILAYAARAQLTCVPLSSLEPRPDHDRSLTSA